jgi:L-threonylcarbamoyladenylate synthase
MYTSGLQHAARVLKQGGIVAYATEYCFGLGCDPFNRDAVLRLLRIKRRPVKKGLIVLAADTGQLTPYIEAIPAPVLASWPGPHTWLLLPRPGVPGWITGRHAKIAVRVTAHAQAAALCHAAGMAIVSTSANRAGEVPARTDRAVARRFGKQVDFILPGNVGKAPAPTPIRDAVTAELIRPG